MEADNVQAIHAVLTRAVEGYRPELRHLTPSPPAGVCPPAAGASVAS
jgi:hypothetical protein